VKRFLFGAACAPFVFLAHPAAAQVHWDVGAEVGPMKRFLGGKLPDASDPGFGYFGEIHAHAAIIPLLRVGAYLSHDSSPLSNTGGRQITSGGLRLKIASPWPSGVLRGWVFTGIGYAGVYAPSYHTQFSANGTSPPVDTFVEGSSGSFWEVPLGVGLGYRLSKKVSLTGELGVRFGLGYGGDVYNGRAGHQANLPDLNVDPAGSDFLATFLGIGVSFEP
jgi:hypothetical protein